MLSIVCFVDPIQTVNKLARGSCNNQFHYIATVFGSVATFSHTSLPTVGWMLATECR